MTAPSLRLRRFAAPEGSGPPWGGPAAAPAALS